MAHKRDHLPEAGGVMPRRPAGADGRYGEERGGRAAGSPDGRAGADSPPAPAAPALPVRSSTEGQLICTLRPEPVDTTRTSSASPEITARPNPGGNAP